MSISDTTAAQLSFEAWARTSLPSSLQGHQDLIIEAFKEATSASAPDQEKIRIFERRIRADAPGLRLGLVRAIANKYLYHPHMDSFINALSPGGNLEDKIPISKKSFLPQIINAFQETCGKDGDLYAFHSYIDSLVPAHFTQKTADELKSASQIAFHPTRTTGSQGAAPLPSMPPAYQFPPSPAPAAFGTPQTKYAVPPGPPPAPAPSASAQGPLAGPASIGAAPAASASKPIPPYTGRPRVDLGIFRRHLQENPYEEVPIGLVEFPEFFEARAKAQYDRGVTLIESPQGYEEAFRLFNEAAKQPFPKAMYNLAVMYEQGLGTIKNIPQAILWYQEAAKLGDIDAQEALARLQPPVVPTAGTTAPLSFAPTPMPNVPPPGAAPAPSASRPAPVYTGRAREDLGLFQIFLQTDPDAEIPPQYATLPEFRDASIKALCDRAYLLEASIRRAPSTEHESLHRQAAALYRKAADLGKL
jgi:TPR repeat protein